MEDDLLAHQRRLVRDLISESSLASNAELFPLKLQRDYLAEPARARLRRGSGGEVVQSFEDWMAGGVDRPVVITGDPGSGKSTLLELFIREQIDKAETVFFLRMGMWSRAQPLLQQLAGRGLSVTRASQILLNQQCWVVLDALDEVRGGNVDGAFEEVVELMREFPSSRVVMSCRSAQLPGWTAAEFVPIRVVPLGSTEVQFALSKIHGPDNGADQGALASELVELCTNTMMLSMTQELLLAGRAGVLQISSAAQLYDIFIDLMEEREGSKRPNEGLLEKRMGAGFSAKIIELVAWKMLREGLSAVPERRAGDWLSEFLVQPRWNGWWGDAPKPSAAELLSYISGRTPLKRLAGSVVSASQITFMHLTLRDAFAGRYLDSISNESQDPSTLRDCMLDHKESCWPAIVFLAGRESEAGQTTRIVVDLAFESRRQGLLMLAARCVEGRWDTPRGDIGDLLISILDAFKNWDTPFDYDLMRASSTLIQRLDTDFPQRLRLDLKYFVDKYAWAVPRAISGPSLEHLLEMLDDASTDVVVNSLYSLARYRYSSSMLRDAVAEEIIRRITVWPNDVVDQAAATLKDVASKSTLPFLREVVETRSYPFRCRAFAANAVANMGEAADMPLLVRLLRDHDFKYRDSISWSLQALAKRVAVRFPETVNDIVAQYMVALRNETNDEAGRYAKGNILYSLGVLHATDFCAEIEVLIRTQTEPYVIEDGLLCLALLGESASMSFMQEMVNHSDPAVRLKACEGLIHCGIVDISIIDHLLEDEYRIVRRLAEQASASYAANVASVRVEMSRLEPVIEMLSRGPDRRDSVKESYRLTSGEKVLVEALLNDETLSRLLTSPPSYIGSGESQELRLAAADALVLRQYFGLED